MNNSYPAQIRILLKRLLLLVVLFQLCRLAFYFSNLSTFHSASFTEITLAFLWGTRFDMAAIFTSNVVLILFHLVPFRGFYTSITQCIIKTLFLVVNIPLLLLNCVDLEYFKFQGKRTTADLFHLFSMGDDMKNTLPQMIIDFWYVLLVFSILTVLLVIFYNKIKVHQVTGRPGYKALNWVVMVLLIGLFVVGARGGLQLKPLGIMAAARLTSPQLVPLVLNTPFTVIRTFGKSLTESKSYMPGEEAELFFNKNHLYQNQGAFRPMNVVLIILESFSSEYISAFNNGNGYTPFLDSLMNQGMTYTNAYANAKKSIDGIPAVVASLPSLMNVSYISSPYNSNKLESIAAILSRKGYSSAFFHGGNNGTMNFDNFTLISGFDKYYGRREYPGGNYDGHWGIFDENFYYFFIDKCTEMKKPFVNVFFSLSSHHPYSIPKHLKGKFPEGPLPIHQSIGYADYALRQFFEKAKQTSWYSNTLFVITSDHTGPAARIKYNTKSGMFHIPVIYYHPGSNLRGWSARTTQQTDIVPGILDYLNFDEAFTAFGNSPFDTSKTAFAINYPGDVYQVIGDSLLIQFDGQEMIAAYKYRTDSLLMNNIVSKDDETQQYLLNTFKSLHQQYNNALIQNQLTTNRGNK